MSTQNLHISKPKPIQGPLPCLLCHEKVTVFKKLHAEDENEQTLVACLICYKHVITDMGYDMCPKCTTFNIIFSIFLWFQCGPCKAMKLQYSIAKVLHFSTHIPVNYCKSCANDYSACTICAKTLNI